MMEQLGDLIFNPVSPVFHEDDEDHFYSKERRDAVREHRMAVRQKEEETTKHQLACLL